MAGQNVITSMLDDLSKEQPIATALCIGQNIDHHASIQWHYFNVTDFLNLPFTQRYEDEKLLRSLGFTQLIDKTTHESNFALWQFNILTYKHVPDWFNSKFWANPENWNKFRW